MQRVFPCQRHTKYMQIRIEVVWTSCWRVRRGACNAMINFYLKFIYCCRVWAKDMRDARDRSERCHRCRSTTPWRCSGSDSCSRWPASRCVRRASDKPSPTESSCRTLASEVCNNYEKWFAKNVNKNYTTCLN